MYGKKHRAVKNEENQSIDKSKRSFAKIGATGSVLMTLTNKPAFGAICTPSGFISATPANASGARHVVAHCNGFSPGAWGTPYSGDGVWSWPAHSGVTFSPGGPNNKINPEGLNLRNSPLGTTMETGFGYPGYKKSESMYNVLWMGGTLDTEQIGAHLVAALLNAASGQYPANGLTVSEVKEMYRQYSTAGHYLPTNGTNSWNAAQIVAFIQQTFH